MNDLYFIDLRNNPITKIQKYRDQIVMLGLRLEELDGKKILE